MTFHGLIGGSYKGRALAADAERSVNWFTEKIESDSGQTKTDRVLLPRPGLKTFTTVTAPDPPPAPNTAVSAVLTIRTAFVLTTGPGIAHVYVNGGLGVLSSATAYAETTTTYTLSPTEIANLPSLAVSLFVDNAIGTITSNTDPSTLQVYDCYLDLTYADTSTARLRPVSALLDTSQGSSPVITEYGTLTNAANAIDANPATFATLTRSAYDALDFYNALVLSFS